LLITQGTSRVRRVRRESKATVEERDRLAAAYVQEHQAGAHVSPDDADTDAVDLRDRVRAREEASSEGSIDRDRVSTF
jgi:hypothetical protein